LREATAAFTFGREGLLPDVRQRVMASFCMSTDVLDWQLKSELVDVSQQLYEFASAS
jgi:hypothetical protein